MTRHKTAIEWTHVPGYRGATWNPLVGCEKISDGCRNCYAIRQVWIRGHHPNPKISEKFKGLVEKKGGKLNWTGDVRLWQPALEIPLKTKRPTAYFVNALSDLFHDAVSDADRDMLFAIMGGCPQHLFFILTKRPDAMRDYFCDTPYPTIRGPLANVVLGVTIENQPAAVERIPALLETPAAWRFVSYEPAVGPLDMTGLPVGGDDLARVNALNGFGICDGMNEPAALWRSLDWVVAGGESGPGARPVHPDWIRSVRDQCKVAGVPFFFKQWGEYAPGLIESDGAELFFDFADPSLEPLLPKPMTEQGDQEFSDRVHYWADVIEDSGKHDAVYRVGKKKAGRELDGRVHDAVPEALHAGD